MCDVPLQDSSLEMALLHLASRKTRLVKARQSLSFRDDECNQTIIVLRGWLCATKQLHDGRTQTISILLEGDICNFDTRRDLTTDLTLKAVSDTIVLQVAYDRLVSLAASNPPLSIVMERSALMQSAIWRERLLSLGQRTAKERCAHLICEMFWRLSAVGVVENSLIEFPLTQEELGNILGVTTVHANRVLQDLRAAGLIEQRRRRLHIRDLRALEQLALFNAKYLDIDGEIQRRALVRGISARLSNQHSVAFQPPEQS